MSTSNTDGRWEVRAHEAGLDHKHCGSLCSRPEDGAADGATSTRAVRRAPRLVVRSDQIVASDPGDKGMLF